MTDYPACVMCGTKTTEHAPECPIGELLKRVDEAGRYWILDENHQPRPARNVLEWGVWFEERRGQMFTDEPQFYVSTIYEGMHRALESIRAEFAGEKLGAPRQAFETMAFAKPTFSKPDGEILAQERCDTWDEAQTQHAAVLKAVRARFEN